MIVLINKSSNAAAGLYGTTLFNGGTNRTYGRGFSGTSSASPIVAGAVASLQGFSKQSKGETLDIAAIRDILTNTGVSAPSGVDVGVRPNLRAAIQFLDDTLSTPTLSSLWHACYGQNDITWVSVPEATSYKLYLDGNYWTSVTSTFKYVNVTYNRTAKVRACNGADCGNFSNNVTLRYASACY